jgi:hypothetical protein
VRSFVDMQPLLSRINIPLLTYMSNHGFLSLSIVLLQLMLIEGLLSRQWSPHLKYLDAGRRRAAFGKCAVLQGRGEE